MTDTDTDSEPGDLSSEEERYEWLKAQITEMRHQQNNGDTTVNGPTWLDRAMGLFASQAPATWEDRDEDEDEWEDEED